MRASHTLYRKPHSHGRDEFRREPGCVAERNFSSQTASERIHYVQAKYILERNKSPFKTKAARDGAARAL